MTSRYAVPAPCTLGEVKAQYPAIHFPRMTSSDMGSGKFLICRERTESDEVCTQILCVCICVSGKGMPQLILEEHAALFLKQPHCFMGTSSLEWPCVKCDAGCVGS